MTAHESPKSHDEALAHTLKRITILEAVLTGKYDDPTDLEPLYELIRQDMISIATNHRKVHVRLTKVGISELASRRENLPTFTEPKTLEPMYGPGSK